MKFITTKIAHYIWAVSLSLVGAGSANAVIMVDSGIDVITKHYVINASLSTVSYNPGTISIGLGGSSYLAAETSGLSGSFDVNFQHYWWSYYQDGDTKGKQGTYHFSSDWIQFVNPVISTNGLPSGFEFPSFQSQVTSPTEFSGSNAACALPMGPDTYCSGNTMGGIAGLSGLLQDSKIIFDGSQPNEQYLFGGGYTYHVDAAVVPVPGAFWLFASALGFLGTRTRPSSKICLGLNKYGPSKLG